MLNCRHDHTYVHGNQSKSDVVMEKLLFVFVKLKILCFGNIVVLSNGSLNVYQIQRSVCTNTPKARIMLWPNRWLCMWQRFSICAGILMSRFQLIDVVCWPVWKISNATEERQWKKSMGFRFGSNRKWFRLNWVNLSNTSYENWPFHQ